MKVEGPAKRSKCDMSPWARIVNEDGSTFAYVPSTAMAEQIIKALGQMSTPEGDNVPLDKS